ncbi:hypothetical protein Tco_0014473 [Tanacetum coccineum]
MYSPIHTTRRALPIQLHFQINASQSNLATTPHQTELKDKWKGITGREHPPSIVSSIPPVIVFEEPAVNRSKITFQFPTRLNSDQALDLERPISCDEIRQAVWGCGEDKSPGPDGFTFEFFRKFWDIIGPDFCVAVKWFFDHSSFSRGCNSSFVALIPKNPDSKFVTDFRPITIRRNFFYGSQEADKNITWVKWSKVLAAKQDGGLGVSSLFSLNRALLMGWPVRGGSESAQLDSLSELIEGVILSNSHDRWFWDMNGSRTYRVKDVRNMLDDFFLPKDEVATRWLPHLPIKLNVFSWRLYLDCLPTKSNLIRRGIQSLGLFVVGGMWCGCLVALTPSGFLGCCRLKWVPGLKVYLKEFGMFPGGRFGCTEIWRFFRQKSLGKQ